MDGSVLFASVLYKLGIYPVLVRIPGHMFVAFYIRDRALLNPANGESDASFP